MSSLAAGRLMHCKGLQPSSCRLKCDMANLCLAVVRYVCQCFKHRLGRHRYIKEADSVQLDGHEPHGISSGRDSNMAMTEHICGEAGQSSANRGSMYGNTCCWPSKRVGKRSRAADLCQPTHCEVVLRMANTTITCSQTSDVHCSRRKLDES